MRPFFAIIPVALFLALATSACIRSGLQLEDAGYVALRVADNVRQGNGIVFNPGEPRDLVDSPLWLGFLAVVSFSTHAPLILQITGLVLGVIVLALVLAGPRLPVAGACASLFLGLDGLFAARATSGTSGIVAALYLVALYIVLRGARGRAAELPHADSALAVWAAAAALVRYEMVLVSIPATLGWALKERHRLRAWVPLFAAIVGAVVVLGARQAHFGSLPAMWEPWPPSAVGFGSAVRALGDLAMHRPLLGLGALVMLATWVRGRFRVGRSAGITWGMFFLAAFSLLGVAGHDVERQLEVILPLAYMLAVDAVWRGARTRLGLVAALLLVAAQPAWTWTARSTSPESRAAYTRLGQWLRTHAIPGTVVGARQVGALGYYGQLQVEDVLGQVSPRVATSRRQQTPTPYSVASVDFGPMLRQEPDLVIVGAAEPVPSAILYVPNLDAVPAEVRGDYGIYRWAGSPVWRAAAPAMVTASMSRRAAPRRGPHATNAAAKLPVAPAAPVVGTASSKIPAPLGSEANPDTPGAARASELPDTAPPVPAGLPEVVAPDDSQSTRSNAQPVPHDSPSEPSDAKTTQRDSSAAPPH